MLRWMSRIGLLLFGLLLVGGRPLAPRSIRACEAAGCIPHPAAQVDEVQTLFQGITYQREVYEEPRLYVVHHVTVDLGAPGLEFFVRPGTPGEPQPLLFTSDFLDEYGLQLAINANYFSLVEEPEGLLDWLYVAGTPAWVTGLAISDGVTYQTQPDTLPSMYVTADNVVSFEAPPDAPFNAITGNYTLLRYAQRATYPVTNERGGIQPRTAIGIDQAGTTLTIVVVDGRQSGYSEGVTLWELADLLVEYGVYYALNLDGGGSSTLVMEGPDGRPEVLNSPIGNRIPGWERPVAVHLGLRALPVTADE